MKWKESSQEKEYVLCETYQLPRPHCLNINTSLPVATAKIKNKNKNKKMGKNGKR